MIRQLNNPDGWLAVRCVDTTNPENMIKFDYKNNIRYDWEKRIKISSRLLTLVDIDINKCDQDRFINLCNGLLKDIRERTSDVILSPFKGNMKDGRRRRRLDFMTCRAIIEKAYRQLEQEKSLNNTVEDHSVIKGRAYAQQPTLF